MALATKTASAEPEKRLFISLLTRDISLVDAVLDLIDNSINSAIILSGAQLSTPDDYISLLTRESGDGQLPTIAITVSEDEFLVIDTCGGIPLTMAETHVFKFGRDPEDDEDDDEDRLSVYGIGLKRAIFKIGDHVSMRSAHQDGGFAMDLHVKAWGTLKQEKVVNPHFRVHWYLERCVRHGDSNPRSISRHPPSDIGRNISIRPSSAHRENLQLLSQAAGSGDCQRERRRAS